MKRNHVVFAEVSESLTTLDNTRLNELLAEARRRLQAIPHSQTALQAIDTAIEIHRPKPAWRANISTAN